MDRLDLEQVKASLSGMGIPYKDGSVLGNQLELIKSFNYEALPLTVDLTNVDSIDAETGAVVRYMDPSVDNGIYIFTVLHSGQAGFIVVEPGTVSRAPLIRKVAGDLVSAVNAVDLPPLMPFDMVEVTAHMLAGTFMKTVMKACRIPKEYEQPFLRLYMPKFLANVGMYFVGAAKEDGSPMVYEEIVNMEPMIVWRSLQKGAVGTDENGDAGEDGRRGTAEGTQEKEAPLP